MLLLRPLIVTDREQHRRYLKQYLLQFNLSSYSFYPVKSDKKLVKVCSVNKTVLCSSIIAYQCVTETLKTVCAAYIKGLKKH